jgi:hypothetical protein
MPVQRAQIDLTTAGHMKASHGVPAKIAVSIVG